MQDYFGIIELVVTAALVLGFGAWQLISVNREIAKDKKPGSPESESPKGSRHPVGEHRLDDR